MRVSEPPVPPSLADLAIHMEEVLAAHRSFSQNEGWQVRAGSPCEREKISMRVEVGPGGNWDGNDADLAAQMSWLLLQAATGYLHGCAALLRSDQPMFPLPPVVRSMFEAMGRAAWLLDPNAAVRARSARVRLLWLDETTRGLNLSKSMDKPNAPAFRQAQQAYWQALRQIFAEDEIQLPPKRPGSRPALPIVCGQEMPSMRRSMQWLEQVHGEQWSATSFYDYLATAAHPTLTPILHTVIDRAEVGGDPSPGREVSIQLDPLDLDYLTTLAMNASACYLDTWILVAQYHGVQTEQLGATRDFYVALESTNGA